MGCTPGEEPTDCEAGFSSDWKNSKEKPPGLTSAALFFEMALCGFSRGRSSGAPRPRSSRT
jgi:hypothetical protein